MMAGARLEWTKVPVVMVLLPSWWRQIFKTLLRSWWLGNEDQWRDSYPCLLIKKVESIVRYPKAEDVLAQTKGRKKLRLQLECFYVHVCVCIQSSYVQVLCVAQLQWGFVLPLIIQVLMRNLWRKKKWQIVCLLFLKHFFGNYRRTVLWRVRSTSFGWHIFHT